MDSETEAAEERPDFLSKYDVVIDTDGSGVYTDGYGGWASLTRSISLGINEMDMGSCTVMNTNRAEFMGLLTGLQRVIDVLKKKELLSIGVKYNVLWLTDRESMTYGISNVESRKADPQLWAQYAYYEQFLNVTAKFIPRETEGTHILVDRLSSEMRNHLIAYAELNGRK